jgi:hypothetical protein
MISLFNARLSGLMEVIMKYFRALAVIVFSLVIATGTPLAAGHDRNDHRSLNQTHSRSAKQSQAEGWSSFKKATYLDKIPSALDEIALSFHDFLGQFGLKLKKPR